MVTIIHHKKHDLFYTDLSRVCGKFWHQCSVPPYQIVTIILNLYDWGNGSDLDWIHHFPLVLNTTLSQRANSFCLGSDQKSNVTFALQNLAGYLRTLIICHILEDNYKGSSTEPLKIKSQERIPFCSIEISKYWGSLLPY